MSDFNPTRFLYLNPELCKDVDVKTAKAYYTKNSSFRNVLHYKYDLPKDFDAEIYLCSSKDVVCFGRINRDIYKSMLHEGCTKEEIETNTMYVANINQPIAAQGNMDSFTFLDPEFDPDLCVNDLVQLNSCMSKIKARIVRKEGQSVYFVDTRLSPNETYTLFGLGLYDMHRLAVINWTRGNKLADSCVPMVNFNPNLYRMLYPDAAHCDNSAAFVHYKTKRNEGDLRIGSADEIVRNESMDTEHITMANNKIRWTSNAVQQVLMKSHYCSNMMIPRESDNSLNVKNTMYVAKTAIIGDGTSISDTVLTANGNVRASDYLLLSDKRTKEDIRPLDNTQCYEMLSRIQPVQFRQFGNNGLKLGLVAQDVPSQFVKKSSDFLPNIAKSVVLGKHGEIARTFCGRVILGIGDKVKAFHNHNVFVLEVRDVAEHTVFVDHQDLYGQEVFLYGTLVDDLHAVDYSQLTALNLAVLKDLVNAVESLLAKNSHCDKDNY
jgi:hypothetical protein